MLVRGMEDIKKSSGNKMFNIQDKKYSGQN